MDALKTAIGDDHKQHEVQTRPRTYKFLCKKYLQNLSIYYGSLNISFLLAELQGQLYYCLKNVFLDIF